MTTEIATGPRAGTIPANRGASLAREANAVFAIAWREILRAVKSPLSLVFTVVFPILFIGVLGGSIRFCQDNRHRLPNKERFGPSE
jgi:hypothetical protein